jgi:abequosyltransferase
MDITSNDQNNIILSICIPTYNRVRYLKESLNAILNQIEDSYSERIEIIISDNASEDRTRDYVQEIILENSNLSINYFRQTKNIGADANFHSVLKISKGKFVYMVSDDDILLPGAISKLLSLIESYPNFDAFCLNIYGFERDEDPYKVSKPAFNMDKDMIFYNKNDALSFLGIFGITFMSTLAFQSDFIKDDRHIDKIGTSLRHSYIYLDVLSKENGLYVTRETFLAGRGGNSSGFDFFTVFIQNVSNLLVYAKNIGYEKKITEKVIAKSYRDLLFGCIVRLKIDKIESEKFTPIYSEGLRMLLKSCSHSIFLSFSSIPLLFVFIMPSKILFISILTLKVIKKLIKKISSSVPNIFNH